MLTKSLKRAAAGAAGISLALTGAAVLASPAHAGTVTSTYTCKADLNGSPVGDVTMNVTSTVAATSDPSKVVFSNTATIPDSQAALLRQYYEPSAFSATAAATFSFATATDSVDKVVQLSIPKTAMPATGAVVVTTSGSTAVNPGIYEVFGADFTSTVVFTDKFGSDQSVTSVCTLPAGGSPSLGKVDARIANAVTLTSAPAAPYVGGPAAVVTAKVAGTGGAPDGSVNFVVGTATTSVKVAADGTAAFTLPAATAAGAVDVTATFVPTDATKQIPSAPVKTTVTFAKAKSATTLTFSPTTALVGDAVNAVAKVVDPSGKALAGSVDFVVAGVTTNVALAADGTATLPMAKPTKGGPVSVTANYKPANAAAVDASTVTGSLSVGPVSTTTKAMAKKKVKFGKVAKVTGMVSTPNAAVVTGKAQVTVKAKGMKAKKVKGNVVAGKVVFKVKKLMKGAYTAQVNYMGVSGSFNASKSSKVKFTVR